MVCDNLSCLGTEALARLGLRLGCFQLMLQSSQFDGVAFDPFSFQKDGLASAEVLQSFERPPHGSEALRGLKIVEIQSDALMR